MIAVILFIIVIAVLIFVHELGHFLAARFFGIRVDEFCVGFPPKIWEKKRGDTNYAIGVIPIGGYVKILGEDGEIEEGKEIPNDSILSKSKPIQIAVLLAGVVFNIIFAWIIFSISFVIGLPSLSGQSPIPGMILEGSESTVVYAQNNMPAYEAGIRVGDVVDSIQIGKIVLEEDIKTEELAGLLKTDNTGVVLMKLNDGREFEINLEKGSKLGVSIMPLSVAKSPWYLAPFHAVWYTLISVKEVSLGLISFIKDIFIGSASLENVAGPVGIASMTEQASKVGLGSLLSFIAIISIHLAVINAIPIPALDGGRVLFILIELAIRRPIKHSIAIGINAVSMILLLILMALVTISDISRLF